VSFTDAAVLRPLGDAVEREPLRARLALDPVRDEFFEPDRAFDERVLERAVDERAFEEREFLALEDPRLLVDVLAWAIWTPP